MNLVYRYQWDPNERERRRKYGEVYRAKKRNGEPMARPRWTGLSLKELGWAQYSKLRYHLKKSRICSQ